MKRIFLIGALLTTSLTTHLLGAESRAYSGERIAVSINGTPYAGLSAWSGGDVRAVVQVNGNKKHVGGLTYDPIVLEVAGYLQAPLADLVKEFCAGVPTPVSLQLFASNAPTLEASKAVLTKVEFPALDGSSKDAARVILTFVAPSTRTVSATNPATPVGIKIRQALASNFRLTVDGLPSTRISTVSSLVISREGGRTFVSNLLITLSSTDADAWVQWKDQFLVEGKNSDAQEKKATLSLLDPAMKTALFSLSLSNVGLVQLTRSEREAEKISRVEAELYIENVGVLPPSAK